MFQERNNHLKLSKQNYILLCWNFFPLMSTVWSEHLCFHKSDWQFAVIKFSKEPKRIIFSLVVHSYEPTTPTRAGTSDRAGYQFLPAASSQYWSLKRSSYLFTSSFCLLATDPVQQTSLLPPIHAQKCVLGDLREHAELALSSSALWSTSLKKFPLKTCLFWERAQQLMAPLQAWECWLPICMPFTLSGE